MGCFAFVLYGNTSTLRRELLVIRWMLGFVLAFQVAIFARLFTH